MAEDFRLSAEKRDQLGTANTRRLRLSGRVPANLYGFKKESINLSVNAEDVERMLTNGSRVVDVDMDGTVDKAEIKELQWDVFSTHVKHVDLKRVDPENIVTVEVPLKIVGEPVGLRDGGESRQLMKRVSVTSPDFRTPPRIEVRVGALPVGGKITVGDITHADTFKIDNDPGELIFEVYNPKKAAE